MKKLIYLALAVFTTSIFTACKDDDSKAWNNYAPVYIWGHDRDGNKAVNQQVEKVHDILVWATEEEQSLVMFSDQTGFTETFSNTMDAEVARVDTINDRAIFLAMRIICDGEINENWLPYRNWYIVKNSTSSRFWGDTVAYIPNAQLDFAEDTIRKLFKAGDYDSIYKIFETAFQFIPCTGAEFKEMKEKGLN